jgi:hypothetical protein
MTHATTRSAPSEMEGRPWLLATAV